jgi:hypothetical protein
VSYTPSRRLGEAHHLVSVGCAANVRVGGVANGSGYRDVEGEGSTEASGRGRDEIGRRLRMGVD